MTWLLLISIPAAAHLVFSGKVESLQKNQLQGNYLVSFDTYSKPLMVDRGPLYNCVRDGLSSQKDIEFSFDVKLEKIVTCKALL
ncbi:hypothetical protein [Bdellovibrio reynosensis]|uniref:Uncharacterized protein n=1 Tax=Bdellovibrio reynosensis TaxID=2835041 RepID=A0ABY4C9Z8_9BACT|nr:hypothetical protein [Bdellovibrio reynosensis]UOF00737.1 hypothetical protein MNR06_13625 [Bdellovibrio reynosensis]